MYQPTVSESFKSAEKSLLNCLNVKTSDSTKIVNLEDTNTTN